MVCFSCNLQTVAAMQSEQQKGKLRMSKESKEHNTNPECKPIR